MGGDTTLYGAGKNPAAPDICEGLGRSYDSFNRLGHVKAPTITAVRGSAVERG